MKKIVSFMVISGLILVCCLGCAENKTRVAEGSVIGGALGAATGAIIGQGKGAGIGAGIGAIAGGIIGSQIEKKQPQETPAVQDASATQVSILQVIELSREGTPDNVIIDKIKKSNSKFMLNNEDINYLKKQGVNQAVIEAMKGA